jgi:two-component system nitrogen regulation sensor histidine kinase GlnL|tara:strand:- start:5015 stop:6115 length:1101 start_codon:yes stop_codon:yes gene_type:complete
LNLLNNSLFSELTTGIIVLDTFLSVKAINVAGENLLDTSSRSAIDKNISEVFYEEPEGLDTFKNCLKNNNNFTKIDAELFLKRGGKLRCDYTIHPFSNEEIKSGLLLEFANKENSSEIKESHRMLTNQKITAEFIRNMAHEIKNPLSGIRGSAQLLNNKLPDTGLREYTEIIIKQTDRLTNLVDNILGPNKKPSFNFQNVHHPIESVMELEKNVMKKTGIAFEKDFDPSIPDLYIDSYLIENSMLNLIKNSRESLCNAKILSPKISIKTRIIHHEYIGKSRHKSACKITVSDNGPGIKEEIKDSIFFPMISGKEDGSGLGLSITQGIISQHKGVLRVESNAKITEFSIVIPIPNKIETKELGQAHG